MGTDVALETADVALLRDDLDNLPYLGLGTLVRDTPRVTAAFEYLVGGSSALGDMDAQAPVPLDVDLRAGKLVYLLLTHSGLGLMVKDEVARNLA
jgi:hypothetical protein